MNRALAAGAMIAGLILFCSFRDAHAQGEKLPPLQPPHGDLAASDWEENKALYLGGAGAVIAVAAGIAVWIWKKPRQVEIIPPAAIARKELEQLAAQTEDGKTIVSVSRIFRWYILQILAQPAAELTTSEFRSLLSSQSRIERQLAMESAEFLRRCDQWKFSPAPPAANPGSARLAMDLIARIEAQQPPAVSAAPGQPDTPSAERTATAP